MKGNQKFSFERNRYYSGKMLTSTDFQIEQGYVNDKRRFINRVMFGNGIVWGGGVYNIDDLSVMIESGAFIDSWGREIIIPQAEIKKLSAIDGFDKVTSESAYLCVVYDEENVNPMYAVRQGEEQLEYNHISEGCKFILIDENDMQEEFNIESEFLTEGTIFNSDDYNMKIVMPAAVCVDKYVKICFILEKKSDNDVEFSFSGTFQLPSFTTDDGTNEYFLDISDIRLKKGEALRKELWVKAANNAQNVKVILQPGTAKAYVDGNKAAIAENLVLDIATENISPIRLVDNIIGKTNLEMRTMVLGSEYVCLARIDFKRTQQGYMICGIEEKSVKRYIEAPADGAIRSEFLEYFKLSQDEIRKSVKDTERCLGKAEKPEEMSYAEGVFEIPLGKGAKKGEVFFSDEIVCGMGEETLHIQIGFDTCEESYSGAKRKVTIFGEADIFDRKSGKEKTSEGPVAQTAVKLYRDKGTFQAGVKFLKDYNEMLLKCRWVSVRRPEGSKATDLMADRLNNTDGYISMEKSTLLLKPGESTYLKVKFVDMEPCPVTYALNEYGSGHVTENGIYTAPETEGIYELNVYCSEKPVISTICFIIVKND